MNPGEHLRICSHTNCIHGESRIAVCIMYIIYATSAASLETMLKEFMQACPIIMCFSKFHHFLTCIFNVNFSGGML